MPISNYLIPRILNRIRSLNEYSDQEIDMMRYGLQSILWETEELIIIGVFFALLHRLVDFFVTLLVLTTIRTFAGGYHSKSTFGCLFWTFSMFVMSILMLPLIGLTSYAKCAILAVSWLATLYAAPLYHIQREHLLKHKAKSDKVTACAITFFWMIVLWVFQDHRYAAPAMWVIFLQNVQLMMEFVSRRRGRT